MQGDCFACYENIVSPSQTSFFPPPWFRHRVVRTMDNTIQCINHYPADKYHRETNYIIHWMGIYLVDSVIQLLSSRARSSVWQKGPKNSQLSRCCGVPCVVSQCQITMATSGKKKQVGFRQKKLPSGCQVTVHLIQLIIKIKYIDFNSFKYEKKIT